MGFSQQLSKCSKVMGFWCREVPNIEKMHFIYFKRDHISHTRGCNYIQMLLTRRLSLGIQETIVKMSKSNGVWV